jgi:hypothetical protein
MAMPLSQTTNGVETGNGAQSTDVRTLPVTPLTTLPIKDRSESFYISYPFSNGRISQASITPQPTRVPSIYIPNSDCPTSLTLRTTPGLLKELAGRNGFVVIPRRWVILLYSVAGLGDRVGYDDNTMLSIPSNANSQLHLVSNLFMKSSKLIWTLQIMVFP